MQRHPQESQLAADIAAIVAGDVMRQRMGGYVQASMLDELGATLRRESNFLGTLREVRNEGFPPRIPPSNVTQGHQDGIACPLCKGHVEAGTCTRCGMAVDL